MVKKAQKCCDSTTREPLDVNFKRSDPAISGTSGSRKRPVGGTIRFAYCDFLLLFYTDLTSVLHRFCDNCRRSTKTSLFQYQTGFPR